MNSTPNSFSPSDDDFFTGFIDTNFLETLSPLPPPPSLPLAASPLASSSVFSSGQIYPFHFSDNQIPASSILAPITEVQSYAAHEQFMQFPITEQFPLSSYQLPSTCMPALNFPAFGSQKLPKDCVPLSGSKLATTSADNFATSIGHIMDHDPVGMACFQAGVVRPGPGTDIHKCCICNIEFPNGQSYGGHMTSHRKRKMKDDGKGASTKKDRNDKEEASLASSSSSSKRKKSKTF